MYLNTGRYCTSIPHAEREGYNEKLTILAALSIKPTNLLVLFFCIGRPLYCDFLLRRERTWVRAQRTPIV